MLREKLDEAQEGIISAISNIQRKEALLKKLKKSCHLKEDKIQTSEAKIVILQEHYEKVKQTVIEKESYIHSMVSEVSQLHCASNFA